MCDFEIPDLNLNIKNSSNISNFYTTIFLKSSIAYKNNRGYLHNKILKDTYNTLIKRGVIFFDT